jgi:hypothetical protein
MGQSFSKWEALPYGVLAGATAFVPTFLLMPFSAINAAATLAAALSATISWLLFEWRGNRRRWKRMLCVGVTTAALFTISPVPASKIVYLAAFAIDPHVAQGLRSDFGVVAVFAVGSVIGAPLVLVLSVAGTFFYWALRGTVVLALRELEESLLSPYRPTAHPTHPGLRP